MYPGVRCPPACGGIRRYCPNVSSIDEDFSTRDIVEPGKKVDNRCFSSAGWSNDGNRLAWLRLEINVFQNWLSLFIFCGYIHEFDLASDGSQGFGIRSILDGRSLIHQAEDSFRAGNGTLDIGP